MKGLRTGIMVLVLLVVGAAFGFAQLSDTQTINFTISNFSEIAVAPTGAIAFSVSSTGVAGAPGDDPAPTGGNNGDGTDDSTYLNYTVLTAVNRTISVGSDIPAPAGTTLTVDLTPATGFFGTDAAAGPYPLDGATNSTIVSAIGSGASGTGATNGAQLTYEFLVTAPGSLTIGTPTMTVTYTITDA